MNTFGFLAIPGELFPEQEIVVCGDLRLTYAQLLDRVRRLGSALRGLGLRHGDRLAVLSTNCHRYLEAFYASALLGVVFVPLNYRAKLPELEHMLRAGRARLLLVAGRYRELAEKALAGAGVVERMLGLDVPCGGLPAYEQLLAEASPECSQEGVEEEETAILMYTSGTTSRPKGALLTHGDFTAYVTANVELADGTSRGAALLAAPLYHIAGATNMMTALWAGRRLVIMPQFEPRQWLELVERERVTHAFLVPTMLKKLLDQPDLRQRDLSHLETLAYGGAAMPLSVIRRALEQFPPTVGFVNAFGQTETTSTLTILGPEDHRLDGPPQEVERRLRRLASIGRPLPDVEVRVVDDAGNPLPPGKVGELEVRTPRVMKGYATEEAGTQVLHDGWLPTRDMAWIDEDGYVFLAGRKDDMIIRGGENIAPAEVESVLETHPDVEEAAVVGVPDEEWGQRVAACVVPRPGAKLSAQQLIEFCRQRLASFKKPEIVEIVDELPKSPVGKVLRRELRARLAATAGPQAGGRR